MANDYLMHYGKKGMKWGVRRYQNKDGTLTPAGKKRYYREADAAGYKEQSQVGGGRYRTTKKGKVERFDADPNKWVKDNLTRSKRLAEESNRLTNELKKANDNRIKNTPKQTMDLSNMTDKEMRDQINRKLLENQYTNLFAPETTSKGREYAGRVLESAGTALAITSSALGVALAIKELRG